MQVQKRNIYVLLGLACAVAATAITVGALLYRQSALDRWIQASGTATLSDFTDEAALSRLSKLPAQYRNLARAGTRMSGTFKQELNEVFQLYEDGLIPLDTLNNILYNYRLIPGAEEYAAQLAQQAEHMEAGKDTLAEAKALAAAGEYKQALYMLRDMEPAHEERARTEIDAIETVIKEETLATVKPLLNKDEIGVARLAVDESVRLYPENRQLEAVYSYIDGYEALMSNLVAYNGPVEHIFTHCLIAFPEITYAGNDMTAAYDMDCLTPLEFKEILAQLYENDYILIDINTLLEDPGGQLLSMAQLMLPAGKKPLILTVEDVAYDSRHLGRGMVDKLIVDDKGKVATYTRHSNGEEVISYDNEVFPLLDAFCDQNPTFSFRGAKGMLALTGYQGVFGYRTKQNTPDDTDYETEKAGALAVAAALKASGWTFASHSYTHAYMARDLSMSAVQEDTELWAAEVKPLVGNTRAFCFPYGDTITSTDPKFQILYNEGFRIFCMVGNKEPFLKLSDSRQGLFQDRRSVDGYTIRRLQDDLKGLFDADAIVDPVRGQRIE